MEKIYKVYTLSLFMAKGDEVVLGDTEAWNVAKLYAHLKIMKHLAMLDTYETIAEYGTESLEDTTGMNDDDLTLKRIDALRRFQTTLRMLIGNTRFAVRKGDRRKVDKFYKKVVGLKKYIDKIHSVITDDVSHHNEIEIDEELFDAILEILIEIKDDINTPLNNANLIFRPSDEVDLDKIIDEIVANG